MQSDLSKITLGIPFLLRQAATARPEGPAPTMGENSPYIVTFWGASKSTPTFSIVQIHYQRGTYADVDGELSHPMPHQRGQWGKKELGARIRKKLRESAESARGGRTSSVSDAVVASALNALPLQLISPTLFSRYQQIRRGRRWRGRQGGREKIATSGRR